MRRRLALAAAVVLAVSGCAGQEGGTGVVEGGPVAYVTPSSDGGDAALLEGTVSVTDVCLTVVDELGQRWLPVFQRPRTTWDGTTLTYDGTSYTDGGHIRLGGGSGSTDSADYVPDGCEFDLAFSVAP
ncbi:hypothetical protein [Cellulomonas septica]|uniref:Lipoprotein n=1 Tax=Cellulomonas septica TaxID=285080 RepID=A0ABX1K1S3_9CELL|nr:hypothetical protein [Cellulomonas septica]NKY39907.1 hypothetical protein [Cellulomonas septica]